VERSLHLSGVQPPSQWSAASISVERSLHLSGAQPPSQWSAASISVERSLHLSGVIKSTSAMHEHDNVTELMVSSSGHGSFEKVGR